MLTSLEIKKQQIQKWLEDKPDGISFEAEFQFNEVTAFTKDKIKTSHLYQRDLPHWEYSGSTYFITFRVNPALGKPFALLPDDPHKEDIPASIVEESIFFGYGDRYIVDAYVIMPDHVHLLIQPLLEWRLSKILQGIKGYSSRMINLKMNRKGAFWQDESMDHLIRNHEDWLDKLNYIHDNPVKAGIVSNPENYPFSSFVTLHSKGRMESLLEIIRVESYRKM